ncbi:MAG: hypothetical protein JNK40_01800 [Chromatiales bacterium]|nr:hypothetical protein [Chromatiales bacterium]
MRNSDHMRGLRLELQAATHFVKAGHKVSWPDVETGQGGADLVLPDFGPLGLQIECKAISADKGRKVHRREALTFNHLLSVELNNCLRTLNTGLVAVLTVPDRLPSAYKDRKELAVRVKQQILAGVSRDFPDGAQIRIDDFDIRQLRRDERDRPAVGRDDVDRLTSTKNRDALLKGNSVGAVLFVVQSARDDSVVPSIFSTLRQASASQCDPSIPTLFVVGLDGVTSDELNEIAEHDSINAAPPTALRRGLSDFLNSTNRGHVIGVSFLGRSGLVPSEGHVTVGSGRVYHFPKTDSRLWHESHAGLFGS